MTADVKRFKADEREEQQKRVSSDMLERKGKENQYTSCSEKISKWYQLKGRLIELLFWLSLL